MPLKINQVAHMGQENGRVAPEEDSALYNFILRTNAAIEPYTSTISGNQLRITDGLLCIYGHMVAIKEEIRNLSLSASGTKSGRLIVRINIADSVNPIIFAEQIETVLPALVQENLQTGSVYEFAICTYTASPTSITNFVATPFASFDNLMYKDVYDTAKNGIIDRAEKLATPRTLQTNLASLTSSSFDGSANNIHGITGVLGLANGGTGRNGGISAENIKSGYFTGTMYQYWADQGANQYCIRGTAVETAGGSPLSTSGMLAKRKI